jgi:hypothetical protein
MDVISLQETEFCSYAKSRPNYGKSDASVLAFVLERECFYLPFASATISDEKPVSLF